MRCTLFAAALLLAAPGTGRADADKPLLLKKPALSKTHIAFGFAGDLWTVGRDGGEARRLTSGAGLEFQPLFSPDGSRRTAAPAPCRRGRCWTTSCPP